METELFNEREERRQARMNNLYMKPVGELVRMIVELEEQVALTKEYRKRLLQIRNIALEPGERRRPGRPTNKVAATEFEED